MPLSDLIKPSDTPLEPSSSSRGLSDLPTPSVEAPSATRGLSDIPSTNTAVEPMKVTPDTLVAGNPTFSLSSGVVPPGTPSGGMFGLNTNAAYEQMKAPTDLENLAGMAGKAVTDKLGLNMEMPGIVRYPLHVSGGAVDLATGIPKMAFNIGQQFGDQRLFSSPGVEEGINKTAGTTLSNDLLANKNEFKKAISEGGIKSVPGALADFATKSILAFTRDIEPTVIGHDINTIRAVSKDIPLGIITNAVATLAHPDTLVNNPAQAVANIAIPMSFARHMVLKVGGKLPKAIETASAIDAAQKAANKIGAIPVDVPPPSVDIPTMVSQVKQAVKNAGDIATQQGRVLSPQDSIDAIKGVLKRNLPGFDTMPDRIPTTDKSSMAQGWDEHAGNIAHVLNMGDYLRRAGKMDENVLNSDLADVIQSRVNQMSDRYPYRHDPEVATQPFIDKMVGAVGQNTLMGLKTIGDVYGSVKNAVVDTFRPESGSPVRQVAADFLRSANAHLAQNYAQFKYAMDAGSQLIDKLPVGRRLVAQDRFETGRDMGSPELNNLRTQMNTMVGKTVGRLQSLGEGILDNAMENWVPRIYTKESLDVYNAKRMLEENGKIELVKSRQKVPAGYEPLADDGFRQLKFNAEKEAGEITGRYYAPADTARLINSRLKDITENPDNYPQLFNGRKPFDGNKSWLKSRVFERQIDAIENGLKPVETNFVKTTMSKIYDMEKLYNSHVWRNEMAKQGYAEKMEPGVIPPHEGWVPLEGSIGTEKVQGNIVGQWWAHPDVAKMLEANQTQGLARFATYRAIRQAFNVGNQMSLSLSGFHAGFIGVEALNSSLAKAVTELSRGDTRNAASTVAKTATLIKEIETFNTGSKVQEHYLNPEMHPELAQIVKSLVEGGMRTEMDKSYGIQGTEMVRSAIKDFQEEHFGSAIGKGVLGGAMSAVELAAAPIMQHFVPKMKLGAAADLMASEMANPKWDSITLAEQMRIKNRVWETVDNRFGQVVYDNTFMNRTVKDLLMLDFRALGWNFGEGRMMAGTLTDIDRAVGNMLQGKKVSMTPNLAYAIAMPIMHGLLASIYQYAHTGTLPQTPRDYVQPLNGTTNAQGQPNRANLPDYMRDAMAYARDPMGTLIGKQHPGVSLLSEFWNNKGGDNYEIWGNDDWLGKATLAALIHSTNKMVPISINKMAQGWTQTEGLPLGKRISAVLEPQVGITQVAQKEVRTPAEDMALTLQAAQRPAGGRPREEIQKDKDMRDLRDILHRVSAVTKDKELNQQSLDILKAKLPRFGEILNSGNLSLRDINTELKKSGKDYLVNLVSQIDVKKIQRVWDVASPDERKTLAPVILNKMVNLSKTGALNDLKAIAPFGMDIIKGGYFNETTK